MQPRTLRRKIFNHLTQEHVFFCLIAKNQVHFEFLVGIADDRSHDLNQRCDARASCYHPYSLHLSPPLLSLLRNTKLSPT
jgi:hypothetical protein